MPTKKKEISKLAVSVIAAMSSFLTPFTSSSVNIALPSIGKDLSLSALSLGWVATAYLLSAGMFLLPLGRIADIYGRKRIYAAGVVIDIAASAMCALLSSETALIFFRGMQGLGGAMIFGTGVAILTSVYPQQERGKALGINVAAVYAGLSTGPLIGGFLTEHIGWRSIFFLNALLGLWIILLVFWKMIGEWKGAEGETFDYKGSLIYSLSLVFLMVGFSVLPGLRGVISIAAGAIGLYGFIAWEKKTVHPLLEITLFSKNRAFKFSNLAAFINYGATFAVVFLLSLYFQRIRGFTAEHAGMIMIVQPLMQIVFSPIAGALSDRVEPRLLASAGMALTTIGLIMLSFLRADTHLAYLIACLIIMGIGFGFFSSPNTNAIMSSVEKKFYGAASGMVGTMRLTGQMFSMGIIMLLFSLYLGKVRITPEYHDLFLQCAKTGFAIFAALCFTGILASLSRGNMHR